LEATEALSKIAPDHYISNPKGRPSAVRRLMITVFACERCGSEWAEAVPGGRCLDCNGVLVELEVEPFEPNEDSESDEEELDAFETENPYLLKLFSMKEFGRAPGSAIRLLQDITPDPTEALLCAAKCHHGTWSRGYLIITTDYLRWIQTIPVRDNDLWTYDNSLLVNHRALVTPDGLQFQLGSAHGARRFAELYRVAQQASLWDEANPIDETVATTMSPLVPQLTTQPSASPDMVDQLERLAQLSEKGLITPEEFTQAKNKLLS
jgi:putative oligomerization/nucleic acid binding protein